MKNLRITDEEVGLIKDAQSGNKAAFSTLFKKYKSFVENLLMKYVKDEDEAHDICNIVFLKVHNKLSSYFAYWTITLIIVSSHLLIWPLKFCAPS